MTRQQQQQERAHWYAKFSEKVKRIIELEKTLELIEYGFYQNGELMSRQAMQSMASMTLRGEKE